MTALVAFMFAALIFPMLTLSVFNYDFLASTADFTTVSSRVSHSPVLVVIRVVSLSEASNTLQISAAAVVDDPLASRIRSGDNQLRITLSAGDQPWATRNILAFNVNKDTPNQAHSKALETDYAQGTIVSTRDLNPYPFDDYSNQMSVDVTGSNNTYLHPDVRVIKLIAGRTVSATGHDDLFDITLTRPAIQKMFVVCAAAIFIFIIIGTSAMLVLSPGVKSPQSLVIAVAGLLLGSVGFRDLIGLTKLSSFSAGDALAVGIPLLALTLALTHAAYRAFRVEKLTPKRLRGESSK